MKEIGMQYEAIVACPNDHFIYYNQHGFATECPECHINRYQIDQVTKKVHRKVFFLYSHYSTFATIVQVQKHSTIYGLP